METLEVLKNRRSIRKYKKEQIKEEDLNKILEAGMYAPTAKGSQSPLIVAVQNKEDIASIDKLSFEIMMKGLGINRDGTAYYGAPTIVLIFYTSRAMSDYAGIIDASSACTNMLNAAYDLGLGTCWIHRCKEVFETKEGKDLLKKWGIAEEVVGVASFALGYPDQEQPSPRPRREGYIVKIK